MKNRILVIGSQCLNKKSQDFAFQQERLFLTRLTWQGSMNHMKMLWCIFQECLGTSPMFLVDWAFETRLFRHLSNFVFGVRNFLNTKAMRVIFFSKCLKFNVDFKNAEKNREKVFCFWDNCFWIVIVILSLLRTGYFSSAANMFTSSTKILTQFTWQWSMKMIKMVWCIFQQCLRTSAMLLLEGSSEAGLFRHLSNLVFGVRHVRNIKARRVIFFSKYLKFNLDFKNAARNSEKGFCFWDNCIWIGIVKLSLLKTGYFSSAANVLTTTLKSGHVKNRDFFRLNWLGSDQWLW